jgi:hypothetical protein
VTEVVARLPSDDELRLLSADPHQIIGWEPLRQEHDHAVYRLRCSGRSFVLKYVPDPVGRNEIAAYELLESYGVPPITVHGHTAAILLLEDLATSVDWRLANRSDIDRPEVGTAVAGWYRLLHAAGRRLIADPQGTPAFLKRESDVLDAAVVRHIGERLQLPDNPVWELAATHPVELEQALRTLPTTLTYGDFHWTNLALSRDESRPLQAVVFDYHLLGIGPVYSDYRNVLSGLGEPARVTFSAHTVRSMSVRPCSTRRCRSSTH